MGGKSSIGPSSSVTSGLQSDANALASLAASQVNQGQTEFNAGFPAYQQAVSYQENLASGDPYRIAQATAPVAQQADSSAAAAKQNILQNGPAGGEKQLALEQVDVNRGATVGNAASNSYLQSFNSLAGLGSQGIGLGQNASSLGISGYGSASNSLTSLGGMQIQGQQIQAQEKGNTLGALASLGSGVAGAAGDAGSFAALFA